MICYILCLLDLSFVQRFQHSESCHGIDVAPSRFGAGSPSSHHLRPNFCDLDSGLIQAWNPTIMGSMTMVWPIQPKNIKNLMPIPGLHQATKQLKQGATFSTLGATTPNSFTAESATDCVGFALKAWWTWKPVNSRWVILSGKKYHSNNNSITLFPKECNLDDLSQYDVQNLPKTYNISINMLHICVYVLCGYVSKWGAHHPVVFLQMDPWVSQVWGIKSFGE